MARPRPIVPPEAAIPALLSITRLVSLWDKVRGSFWFVPSLMAATAVALSFLLVQVDVWLSAETLERFGTLYTFGPEGARAILSVIASSMVTVASLIFSITMLTLQLASSQFGPRLLRNFMRDRINQVVLGTFLSTFLYSLLVLRTVRGTEDASFVPHVAVAFGVVLAVASVAVLIYFIHHVATSIRIETQLSQLAAEMHAAVDRIYPTPVGQEPPQPDAALPSDADFADESRRVPAGEGGYVQHVNVDALLEIAVEHDLVVRIDAAPGRFVEAHDALVTAYPGKRVPDEVADSLRGTLVVGPDRTPLQDIEFSIRRIVEIAQRSLSPGINDPTTALYCIDRLGEGLGRLAVRSVPSPVRVDDDNRARVLTTTHDFEALACPALAAVARYGLQDRDVMTHLLRTMDGLSDRAPAAARTAFNRLRERIADAQQAAI